MRGGQVRGELGVKEERGDDEHTSMDHGGLRSTGGGGLLLMLEPW
jgi:hypothetical protein